MPRQPRLDIPGLLQHVIVRGIERSEIFLDDKDRRRFVDRFDQLLVETETDCYAWALVPNHFHILLRCNRGELSRFMRRLLTGYAVYFNLRHNRSGHLFQNRYKSIVCEEDPYFLELVRYIHLNPLRAGLISGMNELDRYDWCGHAVVLGHRTLSGQSVDEVLSRFGKRVTSAREHYRDFVFDGLSMGKRADLIGSGAGRTQSPGATGEKGEDFDGRILGSCDFVKTLREEDALREGLSQPFSLAELQKSVADFFAVTPEFVGKRGRQNETSFARALFCYLAVTKLRCSGAEVGRMLRIGSSSVSRAVQRGEELFRSREDLHVWWGRFLKQ